MTEKQSKLIYLDSSAYLALLLGDGRAKSIQKTLKGHKVCSSTLMLIEVERNLIRLSREGHIKSEDYAELMAKFKSDIELFIMRDVTADLALNTVFPVVRIPRSSDLTHLRTAHWFQKNESLNLFLTCDQAQSQAAEEIGLPILCVS